MSVYSTCKTIQWEGERGMGQGARTQTRDARSATVPYVVPLPVSPTCNIFFNQHPLTLYTKKTEIYLAFSTHAPTHLWMVVLMWVFLFCLNALATVPNPFPCFYLHYHMNRKHEKKKKTLTIRVTERSRTYFLALFSSFSSPFVTRCLFNLPTAKLHKSFYKLAQQSACVIGAVFFADVEQQCLFAVVSRHGVVQIRCSASLSQLILYAPQSETLIWAGPN